MTYELHVKYRPQKLADVVGQEDAVRVLQARIDDKKVPHATLLSGPAGVGKTSIARIMAIIAGARGMDITEMDCADFRGIDTIHALREQIWKHPVEGTALAWIMDEFHAATSDAQDAFLKMLEEPPPRTFFFLATTDPDKLKPTVVSRCLHVALKSVSPSHLRKLLQGVAAKESIRPPLTEAVLDQLVEAADGSPRRALMSLSAVAAIKDERGRLDAIISQDTKSRAIDVFVALMYRKVKWPELAKTLRSLNEAEKPETIRRIILGAANNELLKSGSARAFRIVQSFRDNTFDAGIAAITSACWELLNDQ